MITINKIKFAKNENEFADAIFHPGGTCSGYYSMKKNGILFSNMQKEPFALLCANEPNSCFFVTCSKREDGKIFYMNGFGEHTKSRLGFMEKDGYTKEVETATAIWRDVTTPKSEQTPAQHTHGPWHVSQDSIEPNWSVVVDESGNIVANVNAESGPDVPPLVSTKMPATANAQLIAAAPELLACCFELLRCISMPRDWKEKEHAIAAIARATGRA